MTAGSIRTAIVIERIAWIRKMLDGIRNLPMSSYDQFTSDPRTPAAAESYLRRALEALLELGRHVLAKGLQIYLESRFGRPVEVIRKRKGMNKRFLRRIEKDIHYV